MNRLILTLAVFLAACSRPADPPRAAAPPPPPDPTTLAFAACKEAIRATLIDPQSAQFSGDRVDAVYNDEITVGVTVNAKNRFGGYVGREEKFCRVDKATGRVTEIA